MPITPDPSRFNPDGLVRSATYADTMNTVVMPSLAALRADTRVAGADDRPLFVSRYDADDPVGTVAIVHGFTENADKFSELIYSLLANHWSVLAWDQRGHGRSWRKEGLENDPSLTHVDKFDEYVRDMEIIVRQRLSAMPKPWRLFAHSMGGAVSSLFLERNPGVFDRVVLCAPMIAPNLSGVPAPLGKLICAVPKALGRGTKRMFVSRPYAYPDDFPTSCATDRARFDWYELQRRDNPLFSNNGPTYGWTLEAIGVTDKILAPGAPEKIDAKVRLYTAEDDNQVMPIPQQKFVARLRQGARVLVKGSKHEIYRSTDEVLFPWWHEILGFYGEAGR